MHNLKLRAKPFRALALLFLGLFALMLPIQHRVFAQGGDAGGTWSRPVPISRGLPGSWYPSLTASDDGLVSAIWTVTQNGQNTIYFSQNNGVAWSRPIDILIGGLHSDLRMDGRGVLHLVYGDADAVYSSDAPALEAGAATNWNKPLQLNRQTGQTGDFVVAPDGTLHAVWSEKDKERNAQTLYGQSQDGGQSWKVYRVIGEQSSQSARARIVRHNNGTLYALWNTLPQDTQGEGIALSISKDNGESWLDIPNTLSFPDEPIRQPALAIDKNNALVLIYNFGVKDETFYQVSTDDGKTWTEQQPIPGLFAANPATGNDYFALATDAAGRIHLVSVGRKSKDQNAPGIYHLVWDGSAWSAPQEIYQQGAFIEFPDIAVSNGNQLHVVFSTRDRYRLSGNPDSTYQVWYSTLQTDAPAATRVALPTFTPLPTGTAAVEITAEPTRRPSATPIPEDPAETTTTGSPLPFPPLFVAIVPVVLIILIVVLTNRMFRRRR